MTPIPPYRLIRRFFQGRLSPHERIELEAWYASADDGADAEVGSVQGETLESVKQQMYNDLRRRMGSSSTRLRPTPLVWRIAAVLAFVALVPWAGVTVFEAMWGPTPASDWTEKSTLPGERWMVTFVDGSRVTLNAGSSLRFPRAFAERSREVILTGEAYFEVARDTARPFSVRSGELRTTVLGTSFNVNAFPEEGQIIVSLLEGQVCVSGAETTEGPRSVMLRPSQQLVYDRADQTVTVAVANVQQAVGWKDDQLRFDHQPLSKILTTLERTYGVRFELADTSYHSRRYSANFNKASLWAVTEVLRKLTGLNVRHVRENGELKKIVFHR
jgi:ferric-dicitrate binding protein FerR (iron transport regulator)